MARKNYSAEQIIGMLGEAGAICRGLEISEQSYYRCCREYGGLMGCHLAPGHIVVPESGDKRTHFRRVGRFGPWRQCWYLGPKPNRRK